MRTRDWMMAAGCAVMLSACGGGGGGGDGDPPTEASVAAAEGFWVGSLSDGDQVTMLVLDDGKVWGLLSEPQATYAAFQAPDSRLQGGTFTPQATRFYSFNAPSVLSMEMSGRVTGAEMQGTVQVAGQPANFRVDRLSEYSQPATASAVAGTWSGPSAIVGGSATVQANIGADGRYEIEHGGCTAIGTITPRRSMVAYDVTATYQASPNCPGGLTVRGVGFIDGAGVLFVTTMLPDRSNASVTFFSRTP